VPHQLRVDARLADTPSDELAVLAPEVDDQHGAILGTLFRRGCGRRERDDLGHGQRL
jgi:hypothetical protein